MNETIKDFISEWFSTVFLGTLVILLAFYAYNLISGDIAIDRYGRDTCLEMGYPGVQVIYARWSDAGEARVFCKNQLESVEIIIPDDLIGN